jgi:uncharacterized protein (TIGR02145 family)
MKKIFFFVAFFVFIYSCSKNANNPSQSSQVVNNLTSCDSLKQGLLKNISDSVRLLSCLNITGCDSIRLGVLKPTKQDTLRLLSCIKISGCDSIRLGVLKPTKQDTLRLLSCIKISGCDSLRFGLIKTSQDSLRLISCYAVGIGNQTWMIENLNVVTYRNGDTIPQVSDPKVWEKLTTGAWCYYDNDAANGAIYGKLYNWYAINDPRGLAPKGWHIPTDTEWENLGKNLGGNSVAGGKMKANNYWGNNSNNESGFTGLPGGRRSVSGGFSSIGFLGAWWSATDEAGFNKLVAIGRSIFSTDDILRKGGWSVSEGFYVRCIKD